MKVTIINTSLSYLNTFLKDEWESVKGTNRVLSMNSLLHKYDRLGLPKDGRLDNPAPYIKEFFENEKDALFVNDKQIISKSSLFEKDFNSIDVLENILKYEYYIEDLDKSTLLNILDEYRNREIKIPVFAKDYDDFARQAEELKMMYKDTPNVSFEMVTFGIEKEYKKEIAKLDNVINKVKEHIEFIENIKPEERMFIKADIEQFLYDLKNNLHSLNRKKEQLENDLKTVEQKKLEREQLDQRYAGKDRTDKVKEIYLER